MVLYTTILDESITKEEIILKYFTRWDIEITIREVKTIMDISVLRGKTDDTVQKEIASAFIAYNLIRKLFRSPQKGTVFPPKKISFKSSLRVIRNFILTEKVEYTKDGLQVDMENLKKKILKKIILQRPGRHYQRRTKKGAYRKYK